MFKRGEIVKIVNFDPAWNGIKGFVKSENEAMGTVIIHPFSVPEGLDPADYTSYTLMNHEVVWVPWIVCPECGESFQSADDYLCSDCRAGD